jgi:hypothetical protein
VQQLIVRLARETALGLPAHQRGAAPARCARVGDRHRHHPAPARAGPSAATDHHDVAGIPAPSGSGPRPAGGDGCRRWPVGSVASASVVRYEHRPHRALGLQPPDPPAPLVVAKQGSTWQRPSTRPAWRPFSTSTDELHAHLHTLRGNAEPRSGGSRSPSCWYFAWPIALSRPASVRA